MQCGTGVSMQEKTAVHVSRLGGGRVMCRGREAEVMAGQWLLAESAEHMQLCDKCVLQQLLLLLLRLAVCLAVLPTFFTTTGVWLPSSSVSVALYTLPKPPEPNSLPSFRSSCACGGGGGGATCEAVADSTKTTHGPRTHSVCWCRLPLTRLLHRQPASLWVCVPCTRTHLGNGP